MFNPKGSLLLEAIIAVGLAASFTTAVVYLALLSNEALSKVEERGEANFLAQQMVEAVMTIKFSDLADISNGKVVFDGSEWSLQSGQEVLPNGMTRRVSVGDVSRDGSCVVVANGGSVDVDTKKITGSVQWTDITGVFKTINHARHHTNWEDPTGPCFGATMAESVSFDISGALYAGQRNLRNVLLTNNDTSQVTITSVTMSWSLATSTIDQMYLQDNGGDNKIWSSTGPGTPAGVQSSGVTVTTIPRAIAPGVTADLNKIRFSQIVTGHNVTISITFSDGSVLDLGTFTPA